jgi:hypothetical protein
MMFLMCWKGRCRVILTSGRKQQQRRRQRRQPLWLAAQVHLRRPQLSGSSTMTQLQLVLVLLMGLLLAETGLVLVVRRLQEQHLSTQPQC